MTRNNVAAAGLALLSLLALARFVYSGIWFPLVNGNWAQLRAEELPPLIGHVLNGAPITSVNDRQYGVVLFLIVHPLLVIGKGDLRFVEVALLAIANLAVLGSLVLIWLRLYGRRDLFGLALLGILWYTFTPIYSILAIKNVEAWLLFFLSLGYFLFTSEDRRLRALAGVPVALGAMTKLLPFVVLGFLALRDRKAFAFGIATVAGLVLVGHLLYGPLMGAQYLPNILLNTTTLTDWTAGWHENDALRGFVYKIAAGFRLGHSYFLEMSEQQASAARLISYLLTIPVVMYLAFVGWRGRHVMGMSRRGIEFSIAILVMLLVSPSTPQEFMLLALPAYATAIRLYQQRVPVAWPKLAIATLAASIVLVGTILPLSAFVSFLPLTYLRDLVGASRLSPAQAYRFFLFPGIGLLLLSGLLLWLEMKTRTGTSSPLLAEAIVANTQRDQPYQPRSSTAI